MSFVACRLRLSAALLALPLLVSPPAAAQQAPFIQPFQSEGPAPSYGPADDAGSRDVAPGNGTTSGAIQAVLPDPTNAGTIFIGAVNGGVWVTHNAGASWTPLTDNQASLSIASLAYDSSNTQVIYAGIGITSNGAVGTATLANRGGARTGILESEDGGTTWNALSSTMQTALIGKSVIGVEANGATILAATAEPQDASQGGAQGYGLYRSVSGGAFTLLGSSSGLPSGAANSLVGGGTPARPYYVAINADDPANSGVYRSVNGGADWTLVRATGANQIGRLATAPNGAVVVALYDPRDGDASSTGGKIIGLSLSQDGTTWKNLSVPNVTTGGQAATNLAIAIDPNNTSIVYVAGDTRSSPPYTANAYRVVLEPDGSSVLELLTDSGTADNSTTHADSRSFAFDAAGRLIMTGDGGVYARTDPSGNDGVWQSLNTTGLSVRESYGVAYDAVSKRLLVAAQDNGVAFQAAPRGATFTPIDSGDGVNAAVNDRTYAGAGQSILYFSTQNLGNLTRVVTDSTGQRLETSFLFGTDGTPSSTKPIKNFVNVDSTHTDFTDGGESDPDSHDGSGKKLPFSSRFLLNANDPTRIAIGTNYVYVTTDALLSDLNNATPLTNVGDTNPLGGVTALAYGTDDNVNALLAGTNGAANARLFFSATAQAGSLNVLPGYGGAAPTGVLFDPRASSRFFVADGSSLFSTVDTGSSFTDQTANLTALDIGRPTSLSFISNNGVNALLVGGLVSSASALSPIAVAMSDTVGALSGWSAFGRGLPNTTVNLLSYNPTVDVLAIGLWGRGIWTLYDVTSYFSTATVLRYGLADNDSAPDASFLTGARPLEKVGTGTLTISGTATYTGTTTVSGGTMLVNGSIASSSSLTIGTAGTVRGIGTLPQTIVNGILWPGDNGIGTLLVNGGLTFNPGSLYQVEATQQASSLTNVTGTATLDGHVQAIVTPGAFAPSRTFTILSATGGLTGGFAGAATNYPFLQASLSYDINDAYLTLAPGGFAQGGQTANQVSVGAALDRSVAQSSGDYASVLDALAFMSSSQAPAVLDQLSGEGYSAFSTAAVQTSQLFMNNFSQQAGGGQTVGHGVTGSRVALAEACDTACEIPAAPLWSAWGGGLGGVGTIAGDSNSHGLTYNIGGFAAGFDRRFGSAFLAGATAGYTHSTQYIQGLSGQANSNAGQFGLYGSYRPGPFYTDLLVGYAHSDNSMQRQISVPGLATRTARGQTSANQFFGQVESGYRVELGGAGGAFVTPFARLQGSTTSQQGFTESGADSLDLNVAPQTTNSLRSVLGVQLGNGFDVGWRDRLALTLRLGWSHDFADTSRPVNASFAGAPAQPFVVTGAPAPRDGAILGFYADTAIAAATNLYLRYDGEIAGGNTSHIFSAGVHFTW
jgi:autotransporter-associated beta strand protein